MAVQPLQFNQIDFLTAFFVAAGTNTRQIGIAAAGITATELNTSVAGAGISGGGGTALAVGAGTGITVGATTVGIDTTSSVTFGGGAAWQYPAGSLTITGTPSTANDAVNKSYVDSLAAGLDPKESCRMGTNGSSEDMAAAPFSGTYGVGSGTNGQDAFTAIDLTNTIDGITPVVGNRVMVKDCADAKQNGIYVVITATAVGEIERAPDHDGTPAAEVSAGNFTFIEQGTVNADAGFVLQGDGLLTLNVDNVVWTQFSGAGSIQAGTGLSKSGNTINFASADSSLTVNANDAQVKLDPAGAITLDGGSAGLEVNAEAAGAGVGGLVIVSNALRVNANTSAGLGLTGSGLGVNLEATGPGAGGLEFATGAIRVDVSVGLELVSGGVAVDLEAAGSGTGGLAFNSNEIRVDVGLGLELLAGGVTVDLEAAGAGQGGVTFNGNELRVDAGNGIELIAAGVSVDVYSGADTSVAPLLVTVDGAGVDTDDTTIEHTAGVLSVKSIGAAQIGITYDQQVFSGNSASTTFNLSNAVPAGFEKAPSVYRNGVRLKYVGSPTVVDEYAISGTTVTFGAAPATGDDLYVDYWY
jgi:hypothetical protein